MCYSVEALEKAGVDGKDCIIDLLREDGETSKGELVLPQTGINRGTTYGYDPRSGLHGLMKYGLLPANAEGKLSQLSAAG